MIGLFGQYRADPAAPSDARPMTDGLPERFVVDCAPGPGASLGRVGHRQSPANGRVVSADGRRSAVAAGAVYNLDAFGDADGPPANAAALVLSLYEAGDLSRLADVNGQYCAAVYDADAHRLLLITDRLATFPLHVWRENGEVVFATQLFTLMADRRVPRKADPAAIAQLFTMQRTIGRTTPLANVEAQPAACVWQIDRGRVSEKRYWQLRWQLPDFSEAEGARRLAEALRRAVRRQLDRQPFGLLLSGGIDSRMILAACNGPRPACWTTASYDANPELSLARRVAALFGAEHNALIVEPPATLDVLDQTVVESSGLYPASTPMSAFLPRVGAACGAAFTGHGLDYTVRGYYLPAEFLEVGGTRTRLPRLRAIPRRPTGRDVLQNLRQGPPSETIARIVRRDRQGDWWNGQARAMGETLAPWLDSEEPYNAWDAFILHAVSKHYAFTGMMAVRAVCDLAMPAFDNEVFETYLRMPPAWRCSGRMAQQALRELSADAARLPNANTWFRADLEPWLQIGGLVGRAALRKAGLVGRPRTPSSIHSAASWQNLPQLYRDDPKHRAHFQAIRGRLDALALDVLDSDGLAACIDEHLDGRANHAKLLRQMLTHDAWVRTSGVSAA